MIKEKEEAMQKRRCEFVKVIEGVNKSMPTASKKRAKLAGENILHFFLIQSLRMIEVKFHEITTLSERLKGGRGKGLWSYAKFEKI